MNTKKRLRSAESVKVYEKLFPGVWSLKGYFDLIDYKTVHSRKTECFSFHFKVV